MSTVLYLIRHGETTYNSEGLTQGQSDVPLSEYGKTQVRILAERLQKTIRVDCLISSDLTRAQESAAILQEYFSVPLTLDSRWREIFWGNWEKKAWVELKKTPQFVQYLADWYGYKGHGGESWEDLAVRIRPALTDIAQQYADQRIVVLTHGGVIRIALFEILQLVHRYYSITIDNASISEAIFRENRWTVKRINDIAHLETDHGRCATGTSHADEIARL